MNKLIFEKIGDINSTYSYLYVYFEGNQEPFMEIAVTDEKKLEFTFYPRESNIVLDSEQMNEILSRGLIFLPKVLADED